MLVKVLHVPYSIQNQYCEARGFYIKLMTLISGLMIEISWYNHELERSGEFPRGFLAVSGRF